MGNGAGGLRRPPAPPPSTGSPPSATDSRGALRFIYPRRPTPDRRLRAPGGSSASAWGRAEPASLFFFALRFLNRAGLLGAMAVDRKAFFLKKLTAAGLLRGLIAVTCEKR